MSGRLVELSCPSRMDSCLGEPGIELVTALNEDNLRLFVDMLTEDDPVDINKEYPEYNHSTILHLAVSLSKNEFVRQILLSSDVNPNYPHKVLKTFPIHVAAEKGNVEVVKCLLEAGADVNARMENGNSPLHIAAVMSNANRAPIIEKEKIREQYKDVVLALLQQETVNVDCENNIGITPFFFAAEKGSEDVIRLLLDKGAFSKITVDDECAESFLSQRFPDAAFKLTSANTFKRDAIENQLFAALYKESQSPGSFLKALEACKGKTTNINLNCDNGAYSLLQYCCDLGFQDLVKLLLDEGADPNYYCVNYQMPPIVLAAHHGYYKILKIFKDLKNAVDFSAVDVIKKENLLHKIIKRESKAYINFEYRNYERCLALILDDNPSFRCLIQPCINASDHLGNTPLHVAAQLAQEDTVRKLLRCEANIGLKNFRGETPILYISPEVMEEYLDDCLLGEGLTTDERFKIIFRYSFLGPPLINKSSNNSLLLLNPQDEPIKYNLPEAEPLWYMSQLPGHRALLNHPVITSFLCMKWRRMRHYYYINLFFYLGFVAALTAHLLIKNQDLDEDVYSNGNQITKVILLILSIILCIREMFQALVSFRRYIFSMENLLEITIIVLSLFICLNRTSNIQTFRSISAAALLLAWAEMVLLLGRHPKISTFVAMFGRISQNFLLVLTWSISFIIAFALSFYIILKRPKTVNEENPSNPYFATVEKSLVKTIVMSLTGEIEFENIEFENDFGKILFLVYVFFIMLVLVNLLNGLAVSDISVIQKEAEIVSHVSRIELISYSESMLLGDPFHFFSNWPPFTWAKKIPDCSCLRRVYLIPIFKRFLEATLGSRRFLLFSERLVEKQAVFYPNRSRQENSKVLGGKKENIVLDVEILESAKARLVKKHEDTITATTLSRLGKIEKTLNLLSQQQNHIIELINNLSQN